MARTYTTDYTLTKPDIGETETEGWGSALNTNFDTLDTQLTAAAHKHNLSLDWFPVRQGWFRNHEHDNLLATGSATEITITAIDEPNNKITLSHLPYRPSIWNPTSGREWGLIDLEYHDGAADPSIGGDYTHRMKITDGTYASLTLDYVVTAGTESDFNVGDKMLLFNPFEEGTGWTWGNSANPIISNGATFDATYPACGPIFQHSDGHYVMLVSGKSAGGVYSIGAYQATSAGFPDTWTVMNSGNAYFSAGGAGWRQNAVVGGNGIFWLDDEDRYIMYVTGTNSSSRNSIGWVKFDEDLGNIEWATSAVMSIAGTVDNRFPSIVKYGGKWRMSYIYEPDATDGSLTDWISREAFASRPEGPFTYDHDILTSSTNDGLWYSNHMTDTMLFVWRGKLYALYHAVSRYRPSGNKNNNELGLLYWDERLATPAWVVDPRSPIFFNPMYASASPAHWDAPYGVATSIWYADHYGARETLWIKNNRLYLFIGSNNGADTYKVSYQYIDLYEVD